MKPRLILLPTIVLLAALACNLPFGLSPDQPSPQTGPLVEPTLAATPTSPPVTASALPTGGTSLPPSATPKSQPLSTPAAALPSAPQTVTVYNPYAVVLVPAGDGLNVPQSPGPSQHPLHELWLLQDCFTDLKPRSPERGDPAVWRRQLRCATMRQGAS